MQRVSEEYHLIDKDMIRKLISNIKNVKGEERSWLIIKSTGEAVVNTITDLKS